MARRQSRRSNKRRRSRRISKVKVPIVIIEHKHKRKHAAKRNFSFTDKNYTSVVNDVLENDMLDL